MPANPDELIYRDQEAGWLLDVRLVTEDPDNPLLTLTQTLVELGDSWTVTIDLDDLWAIVRLLRERGLSEAD